MPQSHVSMFFFFLKPVLDDAECPQDMRVELRDCGTIRYLKLVIPLGYTDLRSLFFKEESRRYGARH